MIASSLTDIAEEASGRVLLGRHSRMEDMFRRIRQVAPTTAPVLIVGETGTGKELIAREIHCLGPRKDRRFAGISCVALPDALLEAELFGVRRGAFTGADADRDGLFAAASGGTVLLDELGSMSPIFQGKILRVLQEKEVTPLGDTRPIAVDVRIVAATHTNMEAGVKSGLFRQDLYYRLNVVQIEVPPLRERLEDIPMLVEYFIRKRADEYCLPIKTVDPEALHVLKSYSWPGNVRELENVISRAMVFCVGPQICPMDICFQAGSARPVTYAGSFDGLRYQDAKDEAMKIFQREYFCQVLTRTRGNLSRAARESGITRGALRRMLGRLCEGCLNRPDCVRQRVIDRR